MDDLAYTITLSFSPSSNRHYHIRNHFFLQMKKTEYLLGLVALCSFYAVNGQMNCTKENLIGQWRQVESMPGIYTNVDSLKKLVAGSTKSIGTLSFNKDDSYTYNFLGDEAKKRERYSFDTTTCEIILSMKVNAREKSNLEIIYIDKEFLIFKEDNNPKGYVTHLLVKM